jgi:hypothetical protein
MGGGREGRREGGEGLGGRESEGGRVGGWEGGREGGREGGEKRKRSSLTPAS